MNKNNLSDAFCYIIVLYCIVFKVFIQRPSTAIDKQRRFWFDQLQEKRQVLRSDKDVERLDDRREARAEGGRRFQREGAITAYNNIICFHLRIQTISITPLQVHYYSETYRLICILCKPSTATHGIASNGAEQTMEQNTID